MSNSLDEGLTSAQSTFVINNTRRCAWEWARAIDNGRSVVTVDNERYDVDALGREIRRNLALTSARKAEALLGVDLVKLQVDEPEVARQIREVAPRILILTEAFLWSAKEQTASPDSATPRQRSERSLLGAPPKRTESSVFLLAAAKQLIEQTRNDLDSSLLSDPKAPVGLPEWWSREHAGPGMARKISRLTAAPETDVSSVRLPESDEARELYLDEVRNRLSPDRSWESQALESRTVAVTDLMFLQREAGIAADAAMSYRPEPVHPHHPLVRRLSPEFKRVLKWAAVLGASAVASVGLGVGVEFASQIPWLGEGAHGLIENFKASTEVLGYLFGATGAAGTAVAGTSMAVKHKPLTAMFSRETGRRVDVEHQRSAEHTAVLASRAELQELRESASEVVARQCVADDRAFSADPTRLGAGLKERVEARRDLLGPVVEPNDGALWVSYREAVATLECDHATGTRYEFDDLSDEARTRIQRLGSMRNRVAAMEERRQQQLSGPEQTLNGRRSDPPTLSMTISGP